jgi:hypothetical protein
VRGEGVKREGKKRKEEQGVQKGEEREKKVKKQVGALRGRRAKREG